jgi:hypothetical protein
MTATLVAPRTQQITNVGDGDAADRQQWNVDS